jgi:uncharacterized protein
MRVIITGGSGLIGRALTKELTQSGYEVVVLSRNPDKVRDLPKNTQVIHWDGRTANGWGEMAEGAEAIVNLAGESIAGYSMLALILNRWTTQRKRSILDSRLSAGKAVVQAVQSAKEKPKVVIQASTVGYYGSRGEEELTEQSEPAPDFLAQICTEWEASTSQVEELGVRRVIIRTGGAALSTKGGAFPFMLLPFRFFVGGPLGNGNQWFSWIHLLDEARAIRFLIENPVASGAFNLCSPNPIRNGEFSHILGKVLHRPSFFPVPGFALQLAFGGKAGLLTGSQKQVPKRLLELGFTFLYPDAESALRDLLVKK